MKSVMQLALGEQWQALPAALQAHYQIQSNIDTGTLCIEFPRWMWPVLKVLHRMGALVDRAAPVVSTVVRKKMINVRQYWQRTMTYPDGTVLHFNSEWIHSKDNKLIEFVNPVLGLEMAVHVSNGRLHYEGTRFVVKVGSWLLTLPEWIALGHTTIVEEALDASHFAMDFRLAHPLFGQVFRYAGKFSTQVMT